MKHPRHWKPLAEVPPDQMHPHRPEVVATCAKHYGISDAEALKMLQDYEASTRCYVNDLYQVQVKPCGEKGNWLHINIRRRDGSMFKDWRHFQQIKNEIAGEEREGVELYPAESRKVDTTNKWHIWVLPEGAKADIGWLKQDISYDENRNIPSLRQRAL